MVSFCNTNINMEKRSIDIRKQKFKEIEEIFEEPKKVNTMTGDRFNWKGASITLMLVLVTVWSVYFITLKLKSQTTTINPVAVSGNKEKVDNTKKSSEITPPELPTTSKNTDTISANPFTPLDSSSSSSGANLTSATNEIAKDSFKVRILNGNGIIGDAAKVKTDLASRGFTVGNVGNANLKYDKTQVYYIAGKQKEAELVVQNLVGKQTEQKEAEQALVGTDYQILVVVGKH